jgi:hypothetical protein
MSGAQLEQRLRLSRDEIVAKNPTVSSTRQAREGVEATPYRGARCPWLGSVC